jgi:hypothetical protein
MKFMEKEIKEKIDKRLITNLELAEELVKRISENPNQRFGQILVNFGFVKQMVDHYDCSIVLAEDPFKEESVDTLKRVKKYGRDFKRANER